MRESPDPGLQEDSPGTPSVITGLPFDIIHILLDYTSPVDLINLCSTCKALHAHLENGTIWKRLCGFCGLRDFMHFGNISPRTVYTSLLHPYGGLLGLWAGDHPFTGSVMEYRLFPGDEHEQGGIIGEVWQFPRSEATPVPTPPCYVRALKISFGSSTADFPGSNGVMTSTNGAPQVYVLCDPDAPQTETPHPHPTQRATAPHPIKNPHLSSLARIHESKTVHHIEFYRRTVDLPEFPKPDAAWFDSDPARIPRIAALPEELDTDQRNIIKIFPALQLPKIWSSLTATVPRPAISIRCPHKRQCPCYALRVPPLPFESLEPSYPQYFPMKRTVLPGVDPRSSAWTLDSLGGIWYGSYGTNGVEVLDVTRATAFIGGMCATKITGDVHVPRGAISWVLDELDENSEDVQLSREAWEELRGEQPPRVLTGRGVLAARGFADTSVVGIIAAIVNADEIQIFWTGLQDFRIYRRYKGREEAAARPLIHSV